MNFEYEIFNYDKWIPINDFSNAYDYEDSPLYGVIKDLDRGIIRVKYLDREDIESLGWYHDQTTKDGAYFYFGDLMSENQFCLNCSNARLSKGEDYTSLYIYNMNNNGNHFEGTIKNKSELKILMKQLGINE